MIRVVNIFLQTGVMYVYIDWSSIGYSALLYVNHSVIYNKLMEMSEIHGFPRIQSRKTVSGDVTVIRRTTVRTAARCWSRESSRRYDQAAYKTALCVCEVICLKGA